MANSVGCKKEIYLGLRENDPTSHSIYYLRKLFPDVFMVSVAGFKSLSIQHNVKFLKL